ncbi:MAG: Ig domain-containing protein, partial [Gemmatimonadales bacterium]
MTARKAPAPGALPLIVTLSAILTACGGGENSGPNPPPPPPPATVASVAVTPAAPQLAPGESVQLAAQPRDASGNPVTGRTVTWSSNNTSAATVSSAGLVSALTAGTATITATADNRSGTATVSVLVPIATLTLTPTSVTLVPSQTSTLAATALSAAGDTLTGRTIAWSTSNPSAATVSAAGVVTAVGAGSTTITA